MASNLKQRMDVRTKKEFRSHIKNCTKRETLCFRPWCEQHNIEYLDTGHDNEGEVDEGEVKGTPDFFAIKKPIWIDGKVSPSDKATFKDWDLKRLKKFNGLGTPEWVVDHYEFTGELVKDITWMVFLNTKARGSNLDISPDTEYFWFNKEDIDWFMENGFYDPANRWFGYKPTYMMNRVQLEQRVKIYRLFK